MKENSNEYTPILKGRLIRREILVNELKCQYMKWGWEKGGRRRCPNQRTHFNS